MPTKEELIECLEWFWLFQDTQEIFIMYFDSYYEEGQVSDDGYEEATNIAEEAWKQFEKKAEKLKGLIGDMP